MTTDGSSPRKRFYKDVTVAAASERTGAFRVLLDGRPLRTPARRELALPSQPLADLVAAEWQAQGAAIDPMSMPLTRIVNSAIDGVTGREAEVRLDILAYGRSDLICYLAEGPVELVELQSRRWGAVHRWAKSSLGVELELAVGIMPVGQGPDQLAALDRALGPRDPLALAALHVATTLTGSLLIVLALLHEAIDVEEAWSLAHIDEDYQIERWGADDEATRRRQRRWRDMRAAASIIALSRTDQG